MSKHFTIKELCKTNRALPNVPDKQVEANLADLIINVLDPLREIYGRPIRVNSGYRSPLVNAAVGGAKNSDHLYGMAADITTGSKSDNALLFKLIRDNFTYKQLIDEKDFSWVHVSFDKNNNKKQILQIK
jgi:zinc D-Ala-D-Ala carboxypeptidase